MLEILLDVADTYVTCCIGRSVTPIEDVARRFGLPTARVRHLVHLARERGLLTKMGQGVRGGFLMPHVVRAYREAIEYLDRHTPNATWSQVLGLWASHVRSHEKTQGALALVRQHRLSRTPRRLAEK